jgi:hypothetical protein
MKPQDVLKRWETYSIDWNRIPDAVELAAALRAACEELEALRPKVSQRASAFVKLEAPAVEKDDWVRLEHNDGIKAYCVAWVEGDGMYAGIKQEGKVFCYYKHNDPDYGVFAIRKGYDDYTRCTAKEKRAFEILAKRVKQ